MFLNSTKDCSFLLRNTLSLCSAVVRATDCESVSLNLILAVGTHPPSCSSFALLDECVPGDPFEGNIVALCLADGFTSTTGCQGPGGGGAVQPY